jgi:hypothetical protein
MEAVYQFEPAHPPVSGYKTLTPLQTDTLSK